MSGVICALIAGAAMSIQGVMNTRLGEKVGVLETNAFVQLVALVLALAVVFFFGKGNIRLIAQSPWYTWLGGVIAPVITVTVMLAIRGASPTVAISAILLSQLTVAALIDAFGWLGAEKLPFTWQKGVGVALMAAGVVLMKLKTT
ncbi:MAG: DMT family transporter [Clostridia bacterium]|nr:DMT family transporter [Clostridia bacterium]